MPAVWIALVVYACLFGASLAALRMTPRLPPHHRSDETNAVVRVVANIFVVVASLVFGLMINSAKNTFESIDRSVHSYATNLILLDHMLRGYGLDGNTARQSLIAYVEAALADPARADDALRSEDDGAGQKLNALGNTLTTITPSDSYHDLLLVDIRQQYRRVVEQRWMLIEQSEGSIPMPLIAMLTAWLTLIFASYGYRAPPNATVVVILAVSSLLIALSVYLVLDMNVPFSGPIQISDAPLQRALAEMRL